jgi:hypothetical protein
MLAEIYNWFTEGLGSADQKNAKALLDELGRWRRNFPWKRKAGV